MSGETIVAAQEAALALPVDLESAAWLHRRARELAVRFNLPAAYDAHYLALAEDHAIELWTADQRLVNSVLPFQLDWIVWVGGQVT